MDPDPDFSGSDPDFWPSRIRTQEKKSDPVKRTRIRNTGFEDTIHYGASGYNRFLGIFLCNYLISFMITYKLHKKRRCRGRDRNDLKQNLIPCSYDIIISWNFKLCEG